MSTSAPHDLHARPRRSTAAMLAGTLALASGLVIATQSAANAAPAVVIDDFEDGDVSDWGYFGGNNAGGGYGVLADRPQEGGFYLSTGWGGEGTASGFYGGMFKNFPDTAQVETPADPWLNVWVLNQSDATVDGYTLELTIREDLDGDGWTSGSEDSFRLDTAFTSASFDDQWTLVSAPLSSLTNLGTGGDGTFNGNLDEIVLVVAGVTGANPSTVEVDFDLFAFSSGGPLDAPPPAVVIDDFEDGDVSDWGYFGGNNAGGGYGVLADRPQEGGFYLSTGWGGEGTASGFYGGMFKNFPDTAQVETPADPWLNVWVLNQSDATVDGYTLELTIREDLDGDGWTNGAEDSFRLDTAFTSASFDDQWTLVSAPLSSLTNLGTGGNGTFDGALDEIVLVVAGVTGANPSTVEVDFDLFAFSSGGPLVPNPETPTTIVDDFENGVAPGTACAPGAPPLGFCTFNGAGSSVAVSNPATPPAPELPAVGTPNSVLQMDVDVTSFAGFIRGFEASGEWVSQDWSTSEGISMWLHGTGSGTDLFIDILDNRNPGSTTDDAERYTVAFVDDFIGWQLLEFPFSSFSRKEIGNGAPNDGLGLFEMHGWALGTLGTGGPRTYYVDEVALYGVAEPPAVAVQFAQQNTFIEEGTTGDVGVKLNRPLGPDDPAQVSIDFATERSNAVPGEDFTPTSGTLTFVNGGPSELSFPVETFDDTKFTGDLQVVIRLTNPVDVERGALFQGSVLIDDNDPVRPRPARRLRAGRVPLGHRRYGRARCATRRSRRSPTSGPARTPSRTSSGSVRTGAGTSFRRRSRASSTTSKHCCRRPAAGRPRRLEQAIAGSNRASTPSRWNNGFFLDESRAARCSTSTGSP